MSDRARLTNALFVSLLVHALILALLPLWRSRNMLPELPPLLDVDVVNLPPPPKAVAPRPAPAPAKPEPAPQQPAQPPPVLLPERQIVSPPDAGEEKPPPETRLLSDRDNTVTEQKVHRGEPAPGPAAPPRPQKAAGDTAHAEARTQSAGRAGGSTSPSARTSRPAVPLDNAPALDKLLPNAQDLVRQGYGRQQGTEGEQIASAGRSGERSDLLKYGGDGWQSNSLGGTFDLLPDVREGDITLLNTKADMFAPFVRRVAIRVFQNLVISLRHDLSRAGALTQEFVTVEAVMNRKGDMVSLQIKDRSATSTLGTDRNLQQACYQGFFDRNPPPGAEAADGNIHFLFDTRVMAMADPRGMAVGYRAIFQAGLL